MEGSARCWVASVPQSSADTGLPSGCSQQDGEMEVGRDVLTATLHDAVAREVIRAPRRGSHSWGVSTGAPFYRAWKAGNGWRRVFQTEGTACANPGSSKGAEASRDGQGTSRWAAAEAERWEGEEQCKKVDSAVAQVGTGGQVGGRLPCLRSPTVSDTALHCVQPCALGKLS